MPERYVRPPLVPSEAPSERLAVWRFRILAVLVLLLLAIALGLALFKVFHIGGNEDPGLTGGLPQLSRLAAAR